MNHNISLSICCGSLLSSVKMSFALFLNILIYIIETKNKEEQILNQGKFVPL